MKLVALTYGMEGDIRPVAALCRALMDAGYEVTLLADRGTLGSAPAKNFPAVQIEDSHTKTKGDSGHNLRYSLRLVRPHRDS